MTEQAFKSPQCTSALGIDRIRCYPAYGIDGPAFMVAFLIGAVLLTLIGVGVAATARERVVWLSVPVLVVAGLLWALGVTMLTYAFLGKQRLRDHLLRQYRWRGDETVLDIGAGRGLMAIGAAKRAPGGRVIALDIWSAKDLSGNTPDALLRNASIESVHNIEIVTGNAKALDLGTASVDVVVSVFCLHNIEPEADRLAACREIARVLKPGGMAMIADFPSAAAYCGVLRECGLKVNGPHRSERVGLGISGYIIASKRTAP